MSLVRLEVINPLSVHLDPNNNTLFFQLFRSKRSDPFSQQQLIFNAHPNMIRVTDNADSNNWKPIHRDTLVNDIITSNGKRGSLVRIEPESEFIRENPLSGNVEPVAIENANIWGQRTAWK